MTLNVQSGTARQTKRGPRYLIPEMEYDYDHPKVVFWTKHFMDEAQKRNVFTNIHATVAARRSQIAAETMATAWYDFTRFVPVFLTKAVALTDDPERQHHLIQIAYDELGGRDKAFIHSNLFLEAIEEIDIGLVAGSTGSSIKEILRVLDRTLVSTQSQYGIVGLLMSFEIIAEENIETLFDGLCYAEGCAEKLSATPFFKIHRADETEHIRHSVANFLRFCQTDTQREEFKRSFDEGIDFWHRFWDQCARLINLEADLRACA
ncbi:iron-containing redox enzyme family protein [Chitinimonas lacunae]|uniref:Iron-containing redox enzyme family protein n=1 Tax=Chitinimonas lacunae TaxID=1963018 RepID=A0ABV8MQ51_9NEIS